MGECIYEELAHPAETGMRVRADTLAALFARAAQAMVAVAEAEPDIDDQRERQHISIESFDIESLLVDWLSELLYWHDSTGLVYTQVEIQTLTTTHLEATVTGCAARRPPRLSIKAITYHGLRVAQEQGGWVADVFFDI